VARRAERGRPDSRYSLRFATAAVILIAGTLVLVLWVLPERYVLRPGFRESGMGFPAPSTPFAPYPAVAVAAQPLPVPPGPPPPVLPGPAEAFWAEVVPLLAAGRYQDALPVFESYLSAYPYDMDARRELTLALLADGRPIDAVRELRRLLDDEGDDAADLERRLLLARTLRELGRVDEAALEYARLSRARPDDVGLILEWAQAYAWVERYDEAAAVLEAALARMPQVVPLRVELARVYYSSDRLGDARAVLAPVSDADLAAAGGLQLRNDILAALYVPPAQPPPPPTPLEQAVAAREADDFARARTILEAALRATPNDAALWQAYADLLQYELGDQQGAYTALLEVERSSGSTVDLGYRLAQLLIGMGRNDEARLRLIGVLAALDAGEGGATVTRPEVIATLGDLRRWEGDRAGAADLYRSALAAEPSNARARSGLAELDAEIARQLVEVEQPRMGGRAYTLADTDDFARLDAGGEWVDVDGAWVWGGAVGNRWVSGVALDGGTADRQGAFVDLQGARWWRWGTLRTAVDVGMQRLRSTWDPSVGGSISHRDGDGATTEVRYEHGLAYPTTATMQSVLTDMVQDHVAVAHARRVGERWTVAAAADVAWLTAEQDSVAGPAPTAARTQGALTIGRLVSTGLTLGLSTRALTVSHPAPVTSLAGGGTLRTFWDPRWVVSTGPYVQLARELSPRWRLTGTLAPGVAFIAERGPVGTEVVPHLSAEAGVRREGARFWTALDLFYSQGQFDGYRTYGARLTLSARDFSTLMTSPPTSPPAR